MIAKKAVAFYTIIFLFLSPKSVPDRENKQEIYQPASTEPQNCDEEDDSRKWVLCFGEFFRKSQRFK